MRLGHTREIYDNDQIVLVLMVVNVIEGTHMQYTAMTKTDHDRNLTLVVVVRAYELGQELTRCTINNNIPSRGM